MSHFGIASLGCLFFGPPFPEPECDTPCLRSDDTEGFSGNIAAGRSVPVKEDPSRRRAGLEACTPCCHATVRQNPGYQTQLIYHLVIFLCPLQMWLPELHAVFQSVSAVL